MQGNTHNIMHAFKYVVRNALEHVNPRNKQISVHFSTNERFLRIEVCDNGPGISDVTTALAPFKHLHQVTGLGLGLSVAKKICELHGGSLIVSTNSRLSHGASVTMRFGNKQ